MTNKLEIPDREEWLLNQPLPIKEELAEQLIKKAFVKKRLRSSIKNVR